MVTIGRHRHSDALLRMDVEDAIEDLSPCPVLEVAADEDPRGPPARFLAEAVAERHCTVCGRAVDAVVCPECGLRIASELLTSKQQHERGAKAAGCTPKTDRWGSTRFPATTVARTLVGPARSAGTRLLRQ